MNDRGEKRREKGKNGGGIGKREEVRRERGEKKGEKREGRGER